MPADVEPAASKTVPGPPEVEPGALNKPDPQAFLDWEGDLCDEANRHYVQYCQTCTLATTVLLGFIFDSIYKSASSSTSAPIPVLIWIGWFASLASLACGMMYLYRSAGALFGTARKARNIANLMKEGKPEEARKLYHDMNHSLEGSTRQRETEGGPYRPGHGWIVAQSYLLGAALVLVSLRLFCR